MMTRVSIWRPYILGGGEYHEEQKRKASAKKDVF